MIICTSFCLKNQGCDVIGHLIASHPLAMTWIDILHMKNNGYWEVMGGSDNPHS
jgi:hypothetical protein